MKIESLEVARQKALRVIEEDEKKIKEREEKRKNKNFVMLFRDNMPEMRWLMKKNANASLILNFIIEHMDRYNALICSYKVFQEYFGISSETVRRSIKLLKDNGFIDILKSGSNNVYIINHEVSWSSWENNKKYCKFEGRVLISHSENTTFNPTAQFEKFKTLRIRENIKTFNFAKS